MLRSGLEGGADVTGIRKQHSPSTKANVAIEALREAKTASQIASEVGVHPIQVSQWKKELVTRASELFQDKRRKGIGVSEDTTALYEQIGRLKMELEWLKKKYEGSRR
jgi:transposase-like protein